jgi:hypothetical protein
MKIWISKRMFPIVAPAGSFGNWSLAKISAPNLQLGLCFSWYALSIPAFTAARQIDNL